MSAYELELDGTGASEIGMASLSGELDLTNARELEERLQDGGTGGKHPRGST